MKIADTLRQECMPEMAYSICKLVASKTYGKEDLRRLISLGNNKLQEYNKVYRFSVECGFLAENGDGYVKTAFTKEQLSTFRKFRYAIARDVFKGDATTFNALARWYLSQDESTFAYKSAQEFVLALPTAVFRGIEQDYILGFRFWMAALGFGMFSKYGNSEILVFAVHHYLLDWLAAEQPFKKGKRLLARDFFTALLADCPAFTDCIVGNDVGLSLSLGLRVLHLNDVLELKYTTDSGDIWHLTPSISNPGTNDITEVILR